MSGRTLIINSQSVPAEAIPVLIKNIEGIVVNVGASVEISNDIGNPLPVTTGQITSVTAITALAAGAVTLAQAKALLTAIDVTEQDLFAAMARLGLKLIQEAI